MNRTLTARGAAVTVTSENDFIEVRAADNTIDAGGGKDTIEIHNQRTYLTATGDNDIFIGERNNTLTVGDGANTLLVYDDDNSVVAGDGDNSAVILASGTTLKAGRGANLIYFKGRSNVLTMGDGVNTIFGLSADDVGFEQYITPSDDNTLRVGDGADWLTVSGDGNYVHAGNGSDSLLVEGDGNRVIMGYAQPDEGEEADAVGDDDMLTVRGDDNTIDAGTGANVLELNGRGNVYVGSGADTIRAEASTGTIGGAVDVSIEGDGNVLEVEGGRLISRGNNANINLTSGSQATISGNALTLFVEGSRVDFDGEIMSGLLADATVEVTTLTSGDFYTMGDVVINGRTYKGSTSMRMTNGTIDGAIAADTPLEGFEGVVVEMELGTATVDGVIYEMFTVPAAAESDGLITATDNVIEGLGWSEGLKISKAGSYTVNGYAFELTPDDTLVGTDDWAGLQLENREDNILFEGTAFSDNMENYGAGVTVDSGIGEDYVSLGSAGREYVAFDADSSLEVEGFATGFDSVSDVLINAGDMRDMRFDFGVTGVRITQKDAELDLINSGNESVDFLLQSGGDLIKFTAVNGDTTLAAGAADFYALNDRATLYAGDGTFAINGVMLPEEYLTGSTVIGSSVSTDYEFTEFVLNSPLVGEYTVHGVSYDSVIDSVAATGQFFVFDGDATVNNYTGEGYFNGLHFATDGRATVEIDEGAPLNNAYRSVKSIVGLGAGDRFTIGANEYTVSADGLSIIDDDGAAVWTGSDVTALNVIDIYGGDVLEERLRDLLLPTFYENVTSDDDGVRINVAGFRQAISARIDEFSDRLTGSTADGVLSVVDEYLTEKFGLVLSDVFSAATLDVLKARLTSELSSGSSAASALKSVIEAGALAPFSTEFASSALESKLGLQMAGTDEESFLRGEASAVDQVITGVLLPNGFASERAVKVIGDAYDFLKNGLSSQFESDGAARLTITDEAATTSADIYVGGSAGVIDASDAINGARIYGSKVDNVSIAGSAQSDMIYAGAGATIDGGSGEDTVIIASGEGTVYINEEIPSTAIDINSAMDAFIDSAEFGDAHTREYIKLSSASSINVIGFETGFDGTTDVIMIDGDANDLEFAFDGGTVDVINGDGALRLTTSSDGSVDVMLGAGGELIKATAIDGGKSATATGADRYYAGEGATLTGLTAGEAFAIVNGDGAINYSVSGDGTRIVRTDKNAVVWSGAASELASVNMIAIDDQQYVFDGIEESISTTIGRDINLMVSVVNGESIVGTTGDDMIFAGANDTVNGNGGNDLIYLTPSTIAPALNSFANGLGARQYVDMRGAGNATVYGFEAGTLATSDVLLADDPYTLRAEPNGIVIEDVDGSVLLAGADQTAAIRIGDEIASIVSDDTTSETPSEDTTSTAPSDDTSSAVPSEDTTTEVVDSSTFIDNSADDINVTLTSAKVGVIGEDATGDKVLTAGDRSTTLENHSAAANTTLVGSARNDSIVAAGGTQLVDISNGGRDTLDIQSGNVDVVGYDVTTKAAFAVDGVLEFNGEGFAGDGWSVKLNGEAPRGVFAAFLDEEGNRQLYGWNEDGSVLDGSAYDQPQHLISEGWSTIKGGSKDDIINATGDVIQLSSGHDLITIDDRAAGEVTIDLGTHLSHSTVTGFDSDDIVKVDDVSALKVKETDDGLMLRAGKAHLTLAGVEDTVRIIDDDLFIFNGGSDIAINGFDDRWQLRAGDGVEIERVTTLVNGTMQIRTTDGGILKLRPKK